MNSKKMKNIVCGLFFAVLFIMSLSSSTSVQAEVIPGVTSVEDGRTYIGPQTINVSEVGTYTLKFTDNSGATKEMTFKIVENTAPVIEGVNEAVYYNTNKIITIKDGNGSGLASVKLDQNEQLNLTEIADKIQQKQLTVSEEGTHTLVATNGSGLSSRVTFTIDKTGPIVTDLHFVTLTRWDEDTETYESYNAMEASGTDNGQPFGGVEYTVVKEQLRENELNYSYRIDPWISRVYLKDLAGNLSTNWIIYQADTNYPIKRESQPPTIAICDPSPQSITSVGNTVEYTVKYNDDIVISKISLSTNNVHLHSTGTVKGSIVSIGLKYEGSYNPVYSINVKPTSGTGTMWITIDEGTALDDFDQPTPAASSKYFTVEDPLQPFGLSTIGISSNHPSSSTYAEVGNVLSLNFKANRDNATLPTVTVFGKPVSVSKVDGSDKNWIATYTIVADDPAGIVPFQISCKDESGNEIASANYTTDGSTVTLDKSSTLDTIPPVLVDYQINTEHWQDDVDDYWWDDYWVTVTGTDEGGSGLASGLESAVVIDSTGKVVTNKFSSYNSSSDYKPDGTYKVYIKDKEGNLSTNFKEVVWNGSVLTRKD